MSMSCPLKRWGGGGGKEEVKDGLDINVLFCLVG